jgi:hypothetical protein
MAKMTEKQFIFEDFKDRVGDVFTLGEPGVPAISLTLEEAELLSDRFALPGMRSPFSLVFLGAGDMILPQALYRLKHEEMGEVTIFMVPIGQNQRGVSYQATFN